MPFAVVGVVALLEATEGLVGHRRLAVDEARFGIVDAARSVYTAAVTRMLNGW